MTKQKKYLYSFLAICAASLLAFNVIDEEYLVFQYFKYIKSISIAIDGKNLQLDSQFAVYGTEREIYVLKSSSDLKIKYVLKSKNKLKYDLNGAVEKGVLTKTSEGNKHCIIYKFSTLFSNGSNNYLIHYANSGVVLDIVYDIGSLVDFKLMCNVINPQK